MNFRYAIPGYIAKFDVRDARNIRFDVNIVSNFIGRFGRLSIVMHTLPCALQIIKLPLIFKLSLLSLFVKTIIGEVTFGVVQVTTDLVYKAQIFLYFSLSSSLHITFGQSVGKISPRRRAN